MIDWAAMIAVFARELHIGPAEFRELHFPTINALAEKLKEITSDG